MELFFNILASLQGIIVIMISVVITTLGIMVKSEGKDIELANNLINGGLMLVPCFFMLVFILGFRY